MNSLFLKLLVVFVLFIVLVKSVFSIILKQQIKQELGCRCMAKGLIIKKSIISSDDFPEIPFLGNEITVCLTIQTQDNVLIDLFINSKISRHINQILVSPHNFDEMKEIVPFKEYTFIYFLHQIGDDEIPTILSFS